MLDNNTFTTLLNLTSIEVSSVEILKKTIIIRCHNLLEEQLCPVCLQKTSKVNKITVRHIRDLPILGKEVLLELTTRQFFCSDCERYFQEKFDFVVPSKQMTIRLEKYLYECCKTESLEKVSARENVGWNTLEEILTRYGTESTQHLEKYQPKYLGIDEFALKKGKGNYATVIVDLEKGFVIDVLPYRDKAQLIAYFEAKGAVYCSQIEVVSCEMWGGFANLAKEIFPQAATVIDRFHFFQLLYRVLDKARKNLRKQFPDELTFKEIKWLLYKSWSDLNASQRSLLLLAFRHDSQLRNLYFLKQELRNIFESDLEPAEAMEQCQKWIESATQFQHDGLNEFLKTFQKWKDFILNFFTYRVTNGVVEGINNLIKTIKRQAYGFRKFESFRLKILIAFD